MNTKHILAVVAVGAAVLSGAFLIQSIYRVTPQYSYTATRRWAIAKPVAHPSRSRRAPQPSTQVVTKVQVGRLGVATKRLQTHAEILRRSN